MRTDLVLFPEEKPLSSDKEITAGDRPSFGKDNISERENGAQKRTKMGTRIIGEFPSICLFALQYRSISSTTRWPQTRRSATDRVGDGEVDQVAFGAREIEDGVGHAVELSRVAVRGGGSVMRPALILAGGEAGGHATCHSWETLLISPLINWERLRNADAVPRIG